MTTVYDKAADRPGTHALVIGAGHYPYCGPAGATASGDRGALARRFGPITSPSLSALAVARWLLSAQCDDEIAPLRSVELLVSPNTSASAGAADSPTHRAVSAAVQRWYQRCDADEDNVAFFFFSGHGCARGQQLLLLLDDFAESPLAPFANAVDVDPFIRGMNGCRAGTQCFFVDGCRQTPAEVLDFSRLETAPLIQPPFEWTFREAPLIYSTTPGSAAFGTEGEPTDFTTALLAALDGLAARRRRPDGPWEVTTDRLTATINDFLLWRGTPRQKAVGTGECAGRPIRRLAGDPRVPVRLGCDPREALPLAELRLVHPRAVRPELRRAPRAAPWEDRVLADYYAMHARFACGRFAPANADLLIHPPHVEFDLPVHADAVLGQANR